MDGDRLVRDASPARLRKGVEASLEALGIDQIDLYQVHWPDPGTPIRQTAAALADLVREGLIRHVGVSNYSTAQITEFAAVLPTETVQPPYHLFRRDIEADLLPYAQAHHIGVLAYGPLAHGLLGGAIAGTTTFGPGDWRSHSPAFTGPGFRRILVAYIVALVIFSAFPGSAASTGWRLVLGLGAVPALIGLVLRTQMPESPRWLLRHGKYGQVRTAMAALGAGEVTEDEVRRAAAVIEQAEGGGRAQRRRAWTPGVRRALVIVSVFFIFQQITGINVPLYYGPHLLGPIFSGAHASLVATTVAGVEVTAIMTAVNVGSTYLGFRWIDTFGRRKLAIGGYTGMIVFALVAALGLALLSGTARLVVIMVGLDFFIASFAIGVGGVGWTLQGEVFPTAVRGQAAAFCAMIDWLANFALIEVFPVWQNAISLGGVLVCFAALAVAAIAFVYWFLPETKGLPVEEIVRVFERQRGPVAPALNE
jgi:MFS family permease